jgi:peptidoglycan/LPS O-acetylase OafA/YrhL
MADFGPWARVSDRDSAVLAVRMSGLPVFLMGLISVLISVFAVGTVAAIDEMDLTEPAPAAIAIVVGAVLVVIGLTLRRGLASLAPFAAIIVLGNAALSLWSGALWSLPLQAIFALMALSGLRGWWWLRQNPA